MAAAEDVDELKRNLTFWLPKKHWFSWMALKDVGEKLQLSVEKRRFHLTINFTLCWPYKTITFRCTYM